MTLSSDAQQLIAEEERIFSEVMRSLEEQLIRSGRQLNINANRARELTAEVFETRREEDKQLLASDEAVAHGLSKLKKDEVVALEKLVENPYFARVVLEEQTEIGKSNGKTVRLEYRLGKHANPECRIVDWRKAPVSKFYYEYKQGDTYLEIIQDREREGTVVLRHRIEISKGELKRISTPLGDFSKIDGIWMESASGFRARGNYGTLPDVLSLVTAEQFKAITDDAGGAVLVQGIAGSGKTTVALYRLSWLTEQSEPLELRRAIILVRSNILRNYISLTLPALALSEAPVSTIGDWLKKEFTKKFAYEVKRCNPPPGIMRVKASHAMARTLEQYVEFQTERFIAHAEKELPWDGLPAELRTQLISFKNAPAKRRQRLLPFIKDFTKTARRLSLTCPGAFELTLKQLENIERRLTLYREDMLRILSDAGPILAHDKTRLLDKQLVEEALRWSKSEEALDNSDMALLLRLAQLKGEALQPGYYDHVVVDEVQDSNPVEIALISGTVVESSRLTLVGDAAQEISQTALFGGFAALESEQKGRLVSLTVSHRSTKQIMALAEHLHGERRASDGRQGKPPLWFRYRTENGAVAEAIDWITRVFDKYPGALITVMCANRGESRHVTSLLKPTFGELVRFGSEDGMSFDEGVLVSEISLLKGLEFPFGLLWNPSAQNYPDTPLNRNLLYTAVTRIEELLSVVTWGNPSPIMPSVETKLCRVVEEEEEEEPQDPLPGEGINFG